MLMPSSAKVTMMTYNQTLYSIPKLIFPSCEPIREIWENLQPGKITHYTLSKHLNSNVYASHHIAQNFDGGNFDVFDAFQLDRQNLMHQIV